MTVKELVALLNIHDYGGNVSDVFPDFPADREINLLFAAGLIDRNPRNITKMIVTKAGKEVVARVMVEAESATVLQMLAASIKQQQEQKRDMKLERDGVTVLRKSRREKNGEKGGNVK